MTRPSRAVNFDDFEDMLRDLRKLGDAFDGHEDFIVHLERYQTAGWPFGREVETFLMWKEFGMGTTVN